MNRNNLKAALPHLSLDEQELLRHLGSATGEDGVTVAMDMAIRHGLTSALGDMGSAVQLLLILLNKHAVELPENAMPSFDKLLKIIADAAMDGANWVCRSHDFDQAAVLALAPEPCLRLQ
jgi:hypothetical protein